MVGQMIQNHAMIRYRHLIFSVSSLGIFAAVIRLTGGWNDVIWYNPFDWIGNGLIPTLLPWPKAQAMHLWLMLMHVCLLVGIVFAWRRPDAAFAVYPFWLLVASPCMCDQFLVLPACFAVIHWRCWWVWPFLVVSTLAVLDSTLNPIGRVLPFAHPWSAGWGLRPGWHTGSSLWPQWTALLAVLGFACSRRPLVTV